MVSIVVSIVGSMLDCVVLCTIVYVFMMSRSLLYYSMFVCSIL